MDEGRTVTLRPIGRVVTGPSLPPEPGWRARKAEIEIDARWADALHGIEGFSHIWLIWWLDARNEPPDVLRVHPEGREEMPLVGIFGTRSPRRPNPIAMTAVRLLARQGRRLLVQGLDAREGTPVLDIKPYIRRGDLISEARMPAWIEELWRLHDAEKEGQDGTTLQDCRQ